MVRGKKWVGGNLLKARGRKRYNDLMKKRATWRRHFVGRLWSTGSSPKDIQAWVRHNMPDYIKCSMSTIRKDIEKVRADLEDQGACPTCGRGGYRRPANLVDIKEKSEPEEDSNVLVPGAKR